LAASRWKQTLRSLAKPNIAWNCGVYLSVTRAAFAKKATTFKRRLTTYILPPLIADAGDRAGRRYVEFFTANISNPNTRRAYARACEQFFGWCEDRALTLPTVRPIHVASWVEKLRGKNGAAGVKQQLAAVRMLFDWLIIGQVVPVNSAAAVRGPKLVVKTGKTPVLDAGEWRKLIDSIPTETVRDLRDRALIATLTFSFARITAALKMKVEDLQPKGSGWLIRLHEKGGKQHAMPSIIRLPRRYTRTSLRPALPRTARAGCFAPARDTSRPC
jgi:site-specific recombinase XerD